ncbi:MAG: RNA polymerase sigma factor [Bacteroidales bacterium]|nr:RNA polymerase sigma factor [Bacteroidales bacterium]MDD2323245.1 RNA polymerase sigma factor [Bacteroidales bacterium]MDD3011693.1 RNA polymerase sigma factor [Bacteroidales bacterium]MDD3961236.1 RNA polymerase sigma factor [Bacteroidales bacterium]MDY0285741.1 RNA polymerase sigma factor [Bacteroidales bacterium]
MDIERKYVERCLENESRAQGDLYRYYAPKMLALCKRYAKSNEEAEDILQEGFIKVFSKLSDFRNEGSLEGWIRRIMINTALNYHKKKVLNCQDLTGSAYESNPVDDYTCIEVMSAKELMKVIANIPHPYRAVFNLNAILGYTHKEIGIMLNISTNTSKSRLSRARNIIQRKYFNLYSIADTSTTCELASA